MNVGGLAFNRGVDIGERIAELTAEVKRLNDLYYGTGDSPLPDADYDALKDELAALVAEHPELEPADSPLGKVNAPAELTGPTVRHARPMLSLAKATGEEQIRTFCERFGGQVFRVSEKLDGLSLSVVYVDGSLDYVATRGTGTVGELVTEKVRHVIPGLPVKIEAPGRVEVRGEAVMLRSVWAGLQRGAPGPDADQPAVGRGGNAGAEGSRGGRERRDGCCGSSRSAPIATAPRWRSRRVSSRSPSTCARASRR